MAGCTPRVLHLLPSLQVGGVERGVLELCGSHEDSLIASAGGQMAERLSSPLLCARCLAWRDPLSVLVINPCLLAAWSSSRAVTHLHSHSRALGLSARIAAVLLWALGRPVSVVVTWHGYYDTSSVFKRAVCAAVLGGADALIFPSHALAAHVERVFGRRVRADRAVIYRGVETTAHSRADHAAGDEAEAPRRPGAACLLLPGRLSRSKGHDMLIAAARLLAAHDDDDADGMPLGIHVVMMGALSLIHI